MLARGIAFSEITLHVGAGTFLPVKTEEIARRKMHTEWGEVGANIRISQKPKPEAEELYLSGQPAYGYWKLLSGAWKDGAFFWRDRYFY